MPGANVSSHGPNSCEISATRVFTNASRPKARSNASRGSTASLIATPGLNRAKNRSGKAKRKIGAQPKVVTTLLRALRVSLKDLFDLVNGNWLGLNRPPLDHRVRH